nr:type II CAAX endopeptidase family protein [Acidipropionibacterium virtanenii]
MTSLRKSSLATPTDRFLAGAGPTHPVLAVILGAAFIAVGQMVVALPVQLIAPHLSATASGIALLCSFIPVWILIWAWLRFAEHRPPRSIGLAGRRADILLGIGIAFLILIVDAVAMAACGQVRFHWSGMRPAALAGVVGLLVLFAIQGSAEEAAIRGYLMQTVAARWGVWAGLVAQAVIFAVLHGSNPGVTPVALGNVAAFGVMLGLLVLWRGDLWAAMGFHAVWNWAQGLVLGFDVSGLGFGGSALTQTPAAGSSVTLTGGSFGAEGSVITLIVLVVLIVALGWAWRRSLRAR